MELTIIDPKEYGLDEANVVSIQEAFTPKIVERNELAKIYEDLIKQELTPELSKDSKELRLKLVKVRTGIAAVHKTQKEYFLSAGRFVDAWKNKETLPVEQMEDKLQEIEKHFENLERERVAKINDERKAALAPYVEDITALNLGEMDADVWDAYFSTKKKAHEDRIESERVAELERIAKAKAEAEEQERIRVENLRLKEEAEKREKEILAERKKQDEALAKERAEAERVRMEEQRKANEKLEAERKEREKLEAELQEKNRLEALAKKEKADAELKAQKEAEKAAKAPVKKQLKTWVDGFSLPPRNIDNEVSREIVSKFIAFKAWADKQVDLL